MSIKSPAFQWYPKDILGSARVQMMTLAEEGAYRRLLDFCWLNKSVPADPVRAAALIGKGATPAMAKTCLAMFEPHPDDPALMVHERLEIERQKQLSNAEKRQRAAHTRWEKDKRGTLSEGPEKQVKSAPDANALQMQCKDDALHSSSSSSSSEKEEPAQDAPPQPKRGTRIPDPFLLTTGMRDWAASRRPGLNVAEETEKFVNYYRAKTGRDATKLDWEATWKNWILSSRSNSAPSPPSKKFLH